MSHGNSMKIAGAILAGGQARRYGGLAKGLLRLPSGTTIIDHLLSECRRAEVAPVVICAGSNHDYARCDAELIPDLSPGAGPLAGIEAALSHFQGVADAVLILACDLPRLTAREMARLARAIEASDERLVVATTGKGLHWHPLCSIVHIELLAEVREAIARGRLSVHQLWRSLGATPVDFAAEGRFVNINTPAQMERLPAQAAQDGSGAPANAPNDEEQRK